MFKVHKINLNKEVFTQILNNSRPFLLEDDDNYEKWDVVIACETQLSSCKTHLEKTGRLLQFDISFVQEQSIGINNDYCIIGVSNQNLVEQGYIEFTRKIII